jgi:hypothetical protein
MSRASKELSMGSREQLPAGEIPGKPNTLYHVICRAVEAESKRLGDDIWSISLAGAVHDAVQKSLALATPDPLRERLERLTVDSLAQMIRLADPDHDAGAGLMAERLLSLLASAPAPAETTQDEVAWLIESGCGFLSINDYHQTYWTFDSLKAVRFARREDAEKVLFVLHLEGHERCHVTGHLWVTK